MNAVKTFAGNNRHALFVGFSTYFFFAWTLNNMNIFPLRMRQYLTTFGIMHNRPLLRKLPYQEI